MMIDYNVSDHWSASTPDWLKSLVSSLDRRHGASTVLPLAIVVDEIMQWTELASGVDAWKKPANRDSLDRDIAQSVASIGSHLSAHISPELAAFRAAFAALTSSGNAVLSQPPGALRTDPAWAALLTAAGNLLNVLNTDDAVRAGWDDLVEAAKDRTLDHREYRPIVELLFEQLQHRGVDAEATFGGLVSIMAFGRDPAAIPLGELETLYCDRLDKARAYVGTPAAIEPVAVWLGYKGRAHVQLTAGRVSFFEPLWAVPNAEPGRQEFDHKEELWEIVKDGITFPVPEKADAEREIETSSAWISAIRRRQAPSSAPWRSSTSSSASLCTARAAYVRNSLSMSLCVPGSPPAPASGPSGSRRGFQMTLTARG